ncbi:MAG: fucose isomerase [Oscillospiraceae bacterium]|nr:fucose isomerase [Oscillospiraceae bacterium]
MHNTPKVNLGLVAVSRDCFPAALSVRRRAAVVSACAGMDFDLFEAQTILENEKDALAALDELRKADVNALVVYLGNFGPEGPETLLAQKFGGPVMFVGAAEETGDDLFDGRGDAFCGMLNASYNLGLRGVGAYIPDYPVGDAREVAGMIAAFLPVARIQLGLAGLKIFGFGPRPYDFLACNAPIKPLFDLGVEIQENSELDLYAAYHAHKGDKRIPEVQADMAAELGAGNRYAGILPRLAQYEITLLDWMAQNLGASRFGVFANKCWPAFQTQFGFVPCYVNARMAARGIPVACETDIYGALSEYIIQLATLSPATLLDINNTVPRDMAQGNAAFGPYKPTDLFMGFHCGNTAACLLNNPKMSFQRIMRRALEPDGEPDITRGTLEGTIRAGDITLFRLQGTADCALTSYMAEGEILPVDPKSFGAISVFAVPEMGRFYRHVLIAKRYPHHAGVAFAHVGRALFDAMKLLGVGDIAYNRPAGTLYCGENPFA